ncbi:MAG: dephospho-CoA kinase [Chitinophagaceae bacterium]|nr:dephospho-CoA kinase [Chitinophagaceae bacterium]
MLKIGLTGGIGSGKSVVADIFRALNIPVFDADFEAKKIMSGDEELISQVKKEFGEESYTEKTLNRSYLAKIVFADPYKLEKLNALVHPATIRAAQKWWQQQNAPYVVKEAALIFEAGSGDELDEIIGVFAPKYVRLKRVLDRDKLSKEEILQRMDGQIDDQIKMRLCDHVIMNDETQMVLPQVLKLHERFLEKSKVKNKK